MAPIVWSFVQARSIEFDDVANSENRVTQAIVDNPLRSKGGMRERVAYFDAQPDMPLGDITIRRFPRPRDCGLDRVLNGDRHQISRGAMKHARRHFGLIRA